MSVEHTIISYSGGKYSTARGGRQRYFLRDMDGNVCSSIYGLCE